jgi:major membrane immunogen (membrane-anchored lipoprotein)
LNKIFEFIARKILLKGWHGKITLHVEDGKITRFNADRSYSAKEIESAQ